MEGNHQLSHQKDNSSRTQRILYIASDSLLIDIQRAERISISGEKVINSHLTARLSMFMFFIYIPCVLK